MTTLQEPQPAPSTVPLSGRKALVTGAGRGIGRAIAIRLAEAGADVCVTARSERELASTVAAVEAAGSAAVAVPCDITEDGAAERIVEVAVRELQGLSVLVNNAGGAHRVRSLDLLSPSSFEVGTRLNYVAVYRTMHAAAPYLFEAVPDACVVNVTSIGAVRGLEGMSYYSAAKAAVTGLSRTVAREWGPRGVRVNCLAPGWVATELSRPLREDEHFTETTLGRVPLGRWGSPEDVADAALFLISDAARYVTGTTLCVDGGFTA